MSNIEASNLLLHRVNILFATVDAEAVAMWSTTDVPVSAPQRATIVMVAPQDCNYRPWLLIKFGDIVHARSLHVGIDDAYADFARSNLPGDNAIILQIDGITFHIYLPTPAVFWCFMHIATGSYSDSICGAGLTREILLDAWKDFTVPGNFPRDLSSD